jgi:PAS domain S-box-containing protein
MIPLLIGCLALLGIGAAAAALHRLALDWGYGPFFLFVGALNVAMWATVQKIFVTASWPLPVSSIVLFPVLLACILVAYAVDGTDRARLLAGAMLIVDLLYQAGVHFIAAGNRQGWFSLSSPEGWNLSPRISFASAGAFLIDIALLVSIHQSIVNRFGRAGRLPAFFFALLGALVADATLFPILAFGATPELVENVGAHLGGKAVAALLLSIPFGLRILASPPAPGLRPVFDFFLPPWDTLSRDLDASTDSPRVPLETLFRSASLLGRELDFEQASAAIVQEGRRVLRADEVWLLLREPGPPESLAVRAGPVPQGEKGVSFPLDGSSNSPLVAAFVERRIVSKSLGVAPSDGTLPAESRSILAVPVEGEEAPIGVLLFATRSRTRFFSPTDHALATAFAGHAASALANAGRVSRILELGRAVAERENQLRLIAGQIPAVVWATDRNLVITLSTGSGLRRLGVRPGELVGKSLAAAMGKAIEDPKFRAWRAVREGLNGESSTFEESFGGRSWQSHLEPLRDEGGAIGGVIGLAIDVTESTEIARKLGESRDEVAAYHDLMTHDLANFSTTLLGLLEVLLQDSAPPLDPGREDLVRRANRQAWELNRLVENARLLARLREAGLPAAIEEEPLRTILDRVESTLRAIHFDSRFELRVEGGATGRSCRIPFFESILLNLVDNAIRHSKPSPSAPLVVRVTISDSTAPGMTISVIGGRPVPPEQIPEIFQRYVRGAHSGGSGLGLALVREIVEHHGGIVRARIDIEGTERHFAVDLELPER